MADNRIKFLRTLKDEQIKEIFEKIGFFNYDKNIAEHTHIKKKENFYQLESNLNMYTFIQFDDIDIIGHGDQLRHSHENFSSKHSFKNYCKAFVKEMKKLCGPKYVKHYKKELKELHGLDFTQSSNN